MVSFGSIICVICIVKVVCFGGICVEVKVDGFGGCLGFRPCPERLQGVELCGSRVIVLVRPPLLGLRSMKFQFIV